MKRFSTILLYVTIAFLLLWQLPWCYNFFVVKPEKTPFTLYSFVIGDFALMGQEEGKGTVRRDAAGNIYSEAAFDSILPMFYFRQLMSDERFPDTINGIAVTPKIVQTETSISAVYLRISMLLLSAFILVGVHVRTCGPEDAG